ncbi:MAG: type IV toxin-antitoxin system AbiEi family antitoxin domain-containing protein [Gammaproteobacteria bacterium]
MNLNQFFYDHPVFRYEEFVAFKTAHGTVKPISVNTALQYYVKSGKIKPVRRKLYAVVPPNQTANNAMIDPYLIASKVIDDAIIGYHSALELMGSAYSSFGQLTYVTARKSKPFEFGGNWYQSVAIPTALQKKQRIHVYVETINRQGIDIKITNAARTFVDVLDRIELCGGWEEVYRSMSNLVVLNIDEVIDYCLMLENARLTAKVGYFLSQRQGAFAVSENQLAPLIEAKPKVPQYVSKLSGEKFQLIRAWNIYLPKSVINQSWEEPDAEL